MAVFSRHQPQGEGPDQSLLDFHDARLCDDLANDRPELFIALCLSNDPASPWCGQLDVGGNKVSGHDAQGLAAHAAEGGAPLPESIAILKAARLSKKRRASCSTSGSRSRSPCANDWARPRGSSRLPRASAFTR